VTHQYGPEEDVPVKTFTPPSNIDPTRVVRTVFDPINGKVYRYNTTDGSYTLIGEYPVDIGSCPCITLAPPPVTIASPTVVSGSGNNGSGTGGLGQK